MSLLQKTCVACKGDEPTLTEGQVEKYLKEVDGDWKANSSNTQITREFELRNFAEALAFVNKVGDVAESEGHHPNIYMHSYNKVKIELFTHKIGGLHENDFILAAKIDAIA